MHTANAIRSAKICTFFFSIVAVAAVILATPAAAQAIASRPQPKQRGNVVHVYLLRGLFNVFSTGMDGIREKLKARNINATVHTHLVWSVLASDAIDDYRKRKVDNIIIIGHSLGATNAVDMANKIGEAGVPVSLVVALDPSLHPTVTSSNVRWVVNLYLPQGMYGYKVTKAAGYTGKVENIEIHNLLVDHVTLDKSNVIQDQTIGYALRAAKGGTAAAAKKPAGPVRTRTGSTAPATPTQPPQ